MSHGFRLRLPQDLSWHQWPGLALTLDPLWVCQCASQTIFVSFWVACLLMSGPFSSVSPMYSSVGSRTTIKLKISTVCPECHSSPPSWDIIWLTHVSSSQTLALHTTSAQVSSWGKAGIYGITHKAHVWRLRPQLLVLMRSGQMMNVLVHQWMTWGRVTYREERSHWKCAWER